MAKIKFGMMMTDARGKLGGQVFSKNRSGAYIRSKVTPTNPQTTFQSIVRQQFGALSQAWSALTSDERLSWDNGVSQFSRTDVFGDIRNPTGKNLYLRLNQVLGNAGLAGIDECPEKVEMVEGIATAAVINLDGGTFTFTGINENAGHSIVFSATASLTQGTTFIKNRVRDILAIEAQIVDNDQNLAAYISKFSTPIAGANIFAGVRYVMPNGQTSTTQFIKVSVIQS